MIKLIYRSIFIFLVVLIATKITFAAQMPIAFDPENFGWRFMSYADYTRNGQEYYVFHPAADLNAVNDSDGDTPVYAIAPGEVVANDDGWGGIVIRHEFNDEFYYSEYGHIYHFDDESALEVGQQVDEGQQIGFVGDIGSEGVHHLHFEIRSPKHPDPENAGYWGLYGANIDTRKKVFIGYEAPLAFIRMHLNQDVITVIIDDSVTYPDIGDDITNNKVQDDDGNVVKELFFQGWNLLNERNLLNEWNTYEPGVGEGRGFEGNYHYTSTTIVDETSYGKWYFRLPEDGYYEILVSIPADHATSEYAIYEIYHNSQYDNIVINQNNVTGNLDERWVSLGTFDFLLGNNHYVKLTNNTGEGDRFIGFDAIKLIKSLNIDVALIIDSSGSMTWNDPQDLRKEAAKIFVDTAQNSDQMTIVDFDSWSYLRWPLQPLTENRDSIKSAVDLIDSSGGTSLSAGLIEGYNQLNSSTQPHKKAAVFLTDGEGSYNNEAELYKNEGNDNECWPIYTIGLGYSTNPVLLQSIADTTGGKYFALTDPDQLKNVYFEIATQIAGGSSLMSESSVMSTGDTYIASVAVPAGQQSVTFLTTWPGSDVNTTLTSPSGSEITPATIDPSIYYAKGLTYELYRITNPEAGIWTASLYGADLAAGGETVNISVSSVGPPVPEDTTPPVITISNPIDGKIYFDQMPTTFSFTIEDPETAVTSQTVLLNGSPINNNDNILLTQLGENVLTITATNEANLTSELSITFYVNHFSWLPPIKYEKGSSTETLTSVIRANSTLPLKFAIFDADSSFIENTTVKVVVEGTTAQFTHGEGDTNIRINQEEGEEPLYIVNIHTNFNKCDYGLEAGNEYWLAVYFDNILAAKTKMKIE